MTCSNLTILLEYNRMVPELAFFRYMNKQTKYIKEKQRL